MGAVNDGVVIKPLLVGMVHMGLQRKKALSVSQIEVLDMTRYEGHALFTVADKEKCTRWDAPGGVSAL